MGGDLIVAGVDGCPAGWIAAIRAGDAPQPRIAVFARFADLLAALPVSAIVAVDMPIGLPARIGSAGRGPERAVRPLLGARQSSVFAVPSRAAVETADYRAACARALETSEPPRMVSKQCFHLFAKIREVDQLLRDDPAVRHRVFEVHPEVAFWRLNGGRALATPKKLKSRIHEPGMAERRALLEAGGIARDIVQMQPSRGASRDDLLDALANCLIAGRIAAGTAQPFPDPPGRDEFGLPIAIWA